MPSKFTAERREIILNALRIGAPREDAAHWAGVDGATLHRWIKKGETAKAGTTWHQFFVDVQVAQANPKMHALGVVYEAMDDKPELAWKFVERRVKGFAPPVAAIPQVTNQPLEITVRFADQLPAMTRGEVIDIEPHALPAASESDADRELPEGGDAAGPA